MPEGVNFTGSVAVDSETMGLNTWRDRLCVVQLSAGDGNAHLVQFEPGQYQAPRLRALIADQSVTKIFHFARFDVAVMLYTFGVMTTPIYCTKIASKLVRTYSDKHGLKELCKEMLATDINKNQQSSDWGAETLTKEQQEYAANDVLHLHKLKAKLDVMLEREGRSEIAADCFRFLPSRARLDISGWPDSDIFAH